MFFQTATRVEIHGDEENMAGLERPTRSQVNTMFFSTALRSAARTSSLEATWSKVMVGSERIR